MAMANAVAVSPKRGAPLGLDRIVMGGAVVALIVLVVLPVGSLFIGSFRGENGLSFDNFREALSGRLYVQALDQFADPRLMDRRHQRPDRRAARLGGRAHQRAGQGPDPDHGQPRLYLAALPHGDRLRQSVRPQRRPHQQIPARRARPAVPHLQHLLHEGPRAGHGAAHVSVRVPARGERAAIGRRVVRGSRANPRRQQMAHGADDYRAAGDAGDPVGRAARLRQFDRAVRIAGDHRPARPHRDAADAHLRLVRLSAGIRPRLRALARLRADHGRRAVPAAKLPRPALLRHARRQGLAPAACRSRARALGAVRLRRRGLRRRDRAALLGAARGVAEQVVGARILEEPDAAQLPFHPVRIRRDAARDPQQPRAGDARRPHRRLSRRHHRLDRSAHHAARAASARLRGAHSARAARHRHGGRA